MKSKTYILSLAALSILALSACSSSDTQTTSSSSTTTTSSSVEEKETLEIYAQKNNFLGEYEYSDEYDAYIISGNLGDTLGDKIAIESFNDTIYDALHKGFQTDKPVIFRGWYKYNGSDTVFTGALIYFSVDNFNREWSSFDSTKTYQFSDGWSTTSKFGQYLSSTSNANDEETENKLFNLLMETK